MKIYKTLTVMIIAWSTIMFAEDKVNYKFYNSKLEIAEYNSIVEDLKDCDVVFFGELHNNIIAHELELQITKDLFEKRGGKMTLGAEMFESDNQLTIDEYFSDFYKTNKFESDVRLWGNYKTDYKPLVEFAKDKNVKFIATNIPRRYASMVFYGGFEALEKLSDRSKEYVAPRPIEFDPELSCYKKMTSMD
ncbi:MAG: ChaN family lipoprotein, partial [Candidatus Delongbacteria bacterium]|nr:ChaN family lipoprotein [Candidatus Delongbacteria bacterium]